MGHLGLVPRKSTWRGGLRAVGRTADEALALMQDFRDLENAGAFSVEAEVIPAEVMAAISPRTGLITVSLGSGPGGDVMYLFQNDICGTRPRWPITGMSSFASISTTAKRRAVITESAPFLSAVSAPRRISSSVG